ncbi:hypothetical protein D3C86_998310 [compost metagenome]
MVAILVNAFTSTFNLLFPFNFLVVTTITPFAERAPQIDAAAASFNTVTDSTSFGLISEKSLLEIGKPSTTIKGFESAYKEVLPRIKKLTLPSSFSLACIPATIPCKALERLETAGLCPNISLLTVENEPVARSLEIV